MEMTCDLRVWPWLTLLWFTAALAPAAASDHSGPAAGSRGPPPPIPTTYRFEHDVIAEKAEDQDRDGKADAWWSYQLGHIVKFELDVDRDGQPDWREAFPPPDKPWREFRLRQIDGRWRLIPENQFQVIHGTLPTTMTYAAKAEKRVGGRWTDTFEDVGEIVYDLSTEYETKVLRRAVKWKFRAGKPVEALIAEDGHYERYTWENGLPASSEYGTAPGRLSHVETYRGGEWFSQLSYDAAGAPTHRRINDAGSGRYEAFRDGKWTGDFVDERRDDKGQLFGRQTYRDGKQTLDESLDVKTGAVTWQTRFDPDGGRVTEQMNPSTSQPARRSRVDKTGRQERVEIVVDGHWTGDFAERGGTFRGGRLVRVETSGSIDGDTRYVVVGYPDDLHEEWSDGKVTRKWLTYVPDPGLGKRLAREARDLDGDGVADLKVDYDALTIEQPEGAKPSTPG